MSKNNFKTFCLILFICFPTLVFSQTTISNEERARLEEKFKGLKTFYIDKDGLVVYTVSNKSDSTSNVAKSAVPVEESVTKVKVTVDNGGDYVVTTEESEQPIIDYTSMSVANEDKSVKQNSASQKKVVEEELFINSQEQEENIVVENVDLNTSTKEKKTNRKKVSQPTKSADTAIAELDDLIGELRAQQNSGKQKNSRSMSNAISRSVDGSLRQKYSHNLLDSNVNDMKDLVNSRGEEDSVSVEYGNQNEPIYYINGVRATVEDFIKLKPENIRRKIIRRSEANSQGEWWIETK